MECSSPSRRASRHDPRHRAPGKAQAVDATAKIVAASRAFLDTLDAAGKAKVQLAYAAPEKKTGWSNLPIGMVPRNGIRMGDLTPAQRTAAMAVLAAAFSQDGYRKVIETVLGDETLRVNAAGRGPAGGPGGNRSSSARTSTTWPSSAPPPPPRRGCCSSAATTWRST